MTPDIRQHSLRAPGGGRPSFCHSLPHPLPLIRALRENTRLPLIAKPNAGLPVIDEQGHAHYSMDPDTFARAMTRLIQAGATLVGGCCGTDPEYIRRLREKREQGAGNREQE